MAKSDHDLIDSAFDAAEAIQAEAMEPTEVSTPEVAERQHPEETVAEIALAERINKKRENKSRDEAGKFLSKGKAPKQAAPEQIPSDQATDEGEFEAPEVETDVSTEEPIEIPTFWSAELKAAAAEAPGLAKKFAEFDAQREQFVRRVKQEAEPNKAYVNRSREMWEPHRAKFAANGVRDEHDAMGRLLGWNEVFEKDPQAGLVDLMRKNGLTPEDLAARFYGQDYGNDAQAQLPTDPRVEEALNKANRLEAMLDDQRRAQGMSQLENFRQGKDSNGQTRAQYFDAYRPNITAAFSEIMQLHPGIAESEALNHAYEFVVGESRKLFGSNGVASQPKAKAPAPKSARAAATSVSGGPVGEVGASRSKLKGNNFNEKLDSGIDAAMDHLGF